MENYLNRKLDYLQSDITNVLDELPLWSSAFGILLLDNFPMGKYSNYLDIGCATGFPLIEIAQRLGDRCNSVGIDPWSEAVKRAKMKIDTLQLDNVSIIEGDASTIDYPNDHFDLITSNLGINNFENPLAALKECNRVLKTNSSFCLTTNLTGTFDEFYEIFKNTIQELSFDKYLAKLNEHINHRGTERSTIELLEKAGFVIKQKIESGYKMRFLNGTTFLNNTFTIVGFIDSWRNLFSETDKQIFFERFEQRLNEYSKRQGELKLTIPMLYVECRKK